MKINLLVIDLSHWDPASDYRMVKATGVTGVIYKATQGSGNNDHTYASQRTAAKSVGLLWGSYHFGDGTNVHDQVQNYLTFANPQPDELICLDYEDYSSQMSIDQAGEWVDAVEKELKRPNQCVLYSGNRIKEDIRPHNQPFWSTRRLWLAQYTTEPVVPAPWAKYWLWQYTDGEHGPLPHGVAGAGNNIDCNHFDGAREQLKAEWASGRATPEIPNVRLCPICHQPLP